MAGSAAGCGAPARGGVARPRGGGGRGGAALEPGDRSAGTLATVALAGIRPLGSARRGAAVAGAGARRLRPRAVMAPGPPLLLGGLGPPRGASGAAVARWRALGGRGAS